MLDELNSMFTLTGNGKELKVAQQLIFLPIYNIYSFSLLFIYVIVHILNMKIFAHKICSSKNYYTCIPVRILSQFFSDKKDKNYNFNIFLFFNSLF